MMDHADALWGNLERVLEKGQDQGCYPITIQHKVHVKAVEYRSTERSKLRVNTSSHSLVKS